MFFVKFNHDLFDAQMKTKISGEGQIFKINLLIITYVTSSNHQFYLDFWTNLKRIEIYLEAVVREEKIKSFRCSPLGNGTVHFAVGSLGHAQMVDLNMELER